MSLGDVFSNKLMPIVLVLLIVFFAPIVLGLMHVFPDLYLYSSAGGIGIDTEPPRGAHSINLKVVAVLGIFFTTLFLIATAIDRFVSKI